MENGNIILFYTWSLLCSNSYILIIFYLIACLSSVSFFNLSPTFGERKNWNRICFLLFCSSAPGFDAPASYFHSFSIHIKIHLLRLADCLRSPNQTRQDTVSAASDLSTANPSDPSVNTISHRPAACMYHGVKACESNGFITARQSILCDLHLRNALALQNAHRSPLMRLSRWHPPHIRFLKMLWYRA